MKKPIGKKIDIIEIKDRAAVYKIDLRWDKSSGHFLAELGGVEFTATTQADILKKLREHAKTVAAYVFKWYIKIDYSVQVDNGRGTSYEDAVSDDATVEGLNFKFSVTERSQCVPVAGKSDCSWRYLERPVEEVNGVLTPTSPRWGINPREYEVCYNETDLHDDVIEYTPERYARLVSISDGLRNLATKLGEFVGGKDIPRIQKVLDALPTTPLLLATTAGKR